MRLFKGFFSGLKEMADDDIDGLVTVMIACLIDEGNYNSYLNWFIEQIKGHPATAIDALSLGIFTNLTQQAADKERRGMRQAIDEVLWKMCQGKLTL